VIEQEQSDLDRRALGTLLREARVGGKVVISAREVAKRSEVGLEWYQSLEAGENVGLSSMALGWVADALCLSSDLRRQAFALANLEEPGSYPVAQAEPLTTRLRKVLEATPELPSMVVSRRGNIVAYNELAGALYGCESIPAERRNVLLFLFTQPEVRKLILDWETQARGAVAVFRGLHDTALSDPWTETFIERLRAISADFARLWEQPPDQVEGFLEKRFSKASIGELSFSCVEMIPSEDPNLFFWTYVPENALTARRLQRFASGYRRRKQAHLRQVRIVQKLRAHLDATYDREVSLDELAALSGASKFTLLRWFVSEVGVPPHGYQLLVRVDKARQLLAEGRPATEVALSVGFSDQSHLIRQFRHLEGVTPGEYVRRLGREEK
jgi:AraC-like DNA-binding protein